MSEPEKPVFLELRERAGYVYCHEVRTGGRTVAVIPYREVDGATEFLARIEICPAHSLDKDVYSITGGIEHEEEPINAAHRELLEESGYDVPVSDFKDLGMVRPSKQMDTQVFLYTVDLSTQQQGAIAGDGTHWEDTGSVKWLPLHDALQIVDPLFIAGIARIRG